MNASVTLRVLTVDDWPAWRDARLAALADAPHAFRFGVEGWRNGGEQQWHERFLVPGTYNLLAEMDGRLAGMARGVRADDGVRELRSVWVAPAARGRGVGDRLIEAVVSWATTFGATALRLSVVPANEAAIALYRRHGFADTDEPDALLPDGVTREQVMVKPLPKGPT
ncbi:GNAT family N-acetyltransferase [Haloactinopolyspora alba]|uniref:GNAT family N-acetyltransferase n=1 Tax=Haloactinopolyspora alba TaxID=648780 RepID=UPI00197AD910|nr:GNAT family N-acetyltransferase [Haloactinopolyspora alba]